MRIFIPSRGRSALQTTFHSLPPELQGEVTLVVPMDEVEEYSHNLRRYKVNIQGLNIQGIGGVRQWCCEQDTHVLMLDDDLVFAKRREDEPTKFHSATNEEILDAIAELQVLLNSYAHVGMATREGGNRNTNNFDYNTRILRVLGYNTSILKEEGIRFDSIPVMEDFYVALSLLTKGHQICKQNWIVHNQNGSGLDGGCSTYRDMTMQAEAAHLLKSHFPDFVSVVEKETKTAWGGGTRTDVRIQWKKALASADKIWESTAEYYNEQF